MFTNGAVHPDAPQPASPPDLTTPDILFRKANVVSGDPDETPYVADVLVSNGLITRITRYDKNGVRPDSLGAEGARVVDAEGWILCPGFIDLHAHSDLYLLTHPDHTPKISQGITVSCNGLARAAVTMANTQTEVIGQDGISYAPIHTPSQLSLIRNQIAGWNGNPTEDEVERMERAGLKRMFGWKTLGEFLDTLELNRPAVNVAMLVPQVGVAGEEVCLTIGESEVAHVRTEHDPGECWSD
jgi:N-acyl-D-amino-acid deacylase